MVFANDIKPALKIALVFLLASLVYIFLSDQLIIWSNRVINLPQATSIQTIKGSLYVFAFSILLFFISRHYLSKATSAQNKLTEYKEQLEEIVRTRTRELEKKTLKLKISQKSLQETIEELNLTTSRLREANRQLEESNKELEAFSYTVSHDLRAPLRSINGFSKVIIEDFQKDMDGTCLDYFQRIISNSAKMEELINEILKLSRISSNPMLLEQVNITDITKKIETELRQSDPDRQFNMKIQEGITVQGDKNLMQIMMYNLIENAWKFTKYQPSANIEVGSSKQKDKEILFVKDNGIGFDMKDVEKLFQPFHRLQNESKFPGTGIGLATVSKIVNRHNGLIWAKAGKEHGAIFYIQLPQNTDETQDPFND